MDGRQQTVTNITLLTSFILTRLCDERLIVALAGPPGAGKSHYAALLAEALIENEVITEVFPMDGFHYDDAILKELGLLSKKGAPETFDTLGFQHMLGRLATNIEHEIAVPVFDRALEISRSSARLIKRNVDVVIVEGNYLLFDQEPWTNLSYYFDITVRIDAEEEVLRQRLMERWAKAKYDRTDALRKVETNDLPNCKLVLDNCLHANFIIKN